ncbi:MAG: hypothetical protein EOP10_15445 [Proteobacteria bacterium]|nr:MAG: hypothetical protein EOP10_15445 [Pseudomonadota bacterium]
MEEPSEGRKVGRSEGRKVGRSEGPKVQRFKRWKVEGGRVPTGGGNLRQVDPGAFSDLFHGCCVMARTVICFLSGRNIRKSATRRAFCFPRRLRKPPRRRAL